MQLPTVKVVAKDCANGYMIINQSEFDKDPTAYELFIDGAPAEPPKGKVDETGDEDDE